MYIKRAIETIIQEKISGWACLTIYGARQVGKSTLINEIYKRKKMTFISMDDVVLRSKAKQNPKEFLASFELPLCIDEIQKSPELLSEIKIIIDTYKFDCLKNNKKTDLLFILTGSNQTDLKNKVNESLVGRTAILHLNSFSYNEIIENKTHNAFSPKITVLKEKEIGKPLTRKELFENIFKGGMPEYITGIVNRDIFFSSYLQTYLEKDVLNLINPTNLPTFVNFMQYVALRIACMIDYNDIANHIGVSVNTVISWINILKTSGIIFFIYPYANNLSSRLIKTPKMYFYDTGLCSYLCKWQDATMLENGVMNGLFFENYVISEIIKSIENAGEDLNFGKMNLYFYRDRNQKEIDLLIEDATTLYPIEIKLNPNSSKPDRNFTVLNQFKKPVGNGLIITNSDRIYKLKDNLYEIPVSLIGK